MSRGTQQMVVPGRREVAAQARAWARREWRGERERWMGRGERGGGPAGNERLTGATAAALLVLLGAEGVTIAFLGPLLREHIFIGMLLITPVALKLASVGYRFVRYYAGSAGPPNASWCAFWGPVIGGRTVSATMPRGRSR